MTTSSKPAAFCALCLAETTNLAPRPPGRDAAMVMVCAACNDEHPRSGRYTRDPTREWKPPGGLTRPPRTYRNGRPPR